MLAVEMFVPLLSESAPELPPHPIAGDNKVAARKQPATPIFMFFKLIIRSSLIIEALFEETP